MVKKPERTFWPMNLKFTSLDEVGFRFEIESNVEDGGKTFAKMIAVHSRNPTGSSGIDVRIANENPTSQAANRYGRSKPPRRSVVSISALRSGERYIDTMNLQWKPCRFRPQRLYSSEEGHLSFSFEGNATLAFHSFCDHAKVRIFSVLPDTGSNTRTINLCR